MAKKPNLASVLDGLPDRQESAAVPTARRRPDEMRSEQTVLVGANLPPRYARNLALLHAETGRSKKQLLTEALDMFFVAKGGPGLS